MLSILQSPLTFKEFIELNNFLSFACNDPSALQLTKTHGLLTAVISAPYIIMPSQWQPRVLGNPKFTSIKQAKEIIMLLMRLNNEISQSLHEGKEDETFKPLLFMDNKIQSLEEASIPILSAWCTGYLNGVKLDPRWRTDAEAKRHLFPFSIFLIDADQIKGSASILYEKNQKEKSKAREELVEHIRYFFGYWSKARKEAPPFYNDPKDHE